MILKNFFFLSLLSLFTSSNLLCIEWTQEEKEQIEQKGLSLKKITKVLQQEDLTKKTRQDLFELLQTQDDVHSLKDLMSLLPDSQILLEELIPTLKENKISWEDAYAFFDSMPDDLKKIDILIHLKKNDVIQESSIFISSVEEPFNTLETFFILKKNNVNINKAIDFFNNTPKEFSTLKNIISLKKNKFPLVNIPFYLKEMPEEYTSLDFILNFSNHKNNLVEIAHFLRNKKIKKNFKKPHIINLLLDHQIPLKFLIHYKTPETDFSDTDKMITLLKFKHAISTKNILAKTMLLEGTNPSFFYQKDSKGISPFDIVQRAERKILNEQNNKDLKALEFYTEIKELIVEKQQTDLLVLKNIIAYGDRSSIIHHLEEAVKKDLLSLLDDSDRMTLLKKINPPHFHCFMVSGAKIEAMSLYDEKTEATLGFFLSKEAWSLGKKITPVAGNYCFVFDSWKELQHHISYLEKTNNITRGDQILFVNASHTGNDLFQVNDGTNKTSFTELAAILKGYAKKYKVGAILHSCFVGKILKQMMEESDKENLCLLISNDGPAIGNRGNPLRHLLKSQKGDSLKDIHNKSYKEAILGFIGQETSEHSCETFRLP